MAGLPTGMVTFLFTGLESSSRLRTEHPEPMPAALARLDALLRAAVQASGGRVVKGAGDRLLCSFAGCTVRGGASTGGPAAAPGGGLGVLGALRVRMALHTGAARLPDEDYRGSAHKPVASLLGPARGGQTVLSAVAAGLVRRSLPVGAAVRDLGERGLGRSF